MQVRMFPQKGKQRANLLYVASCTRWLKIFLTLASFWICGQNIDNMYLSDHNELQCDHHIHVVEDEFMVVQSKTIAAKCVANCPTQLICTWIFICCSFVVFHDKAKRTQRGDLLQSVAILLLYRRQKTDRTAYMPSKLPSRPRSPSSLPTYPQKHSRRPRVGSSASLFHSLRPATL